MDINQLKYFICVAEHLNFTKAAEKLYISQTAISQQIKSLEDSLNVQLFIRNNRKVSLTPAGESFYNKVKLIIDELDIAIHDTVKIASGYKGSLKIGFTRGHSTLIIYNLIKEFIKRYPLIDITVLDDNLNNLYEHLNNKTLDLIFGIDFNLEDIKNFRYFHLSREPIYVVMNNNHPLANSTSLHRYDLKNESFVFLNKLESPAGYNKMISNCVKSGFTPNIVKHCNSLASLSLLIKLGIGISFFPKFQLSDFTDSLTFIPLEDNDEFIDHVLIWNNINKNPTINLFLDCLL